MDLATLGLKVDSSQVDEGISKLDKLANAGDKAETSTHSLQSATESFNSSVANTVQQLGGSTSALEREAQAANSARNATQGAASASSEMADRVARLRASVDPLGVAIDNVNDELAEAETLFARGAISASEYGDASQVLMARQRAMATQQERANAILMGTASASKLTASEMLNLGRQAQDVGVSMAMGMNPLMILAQQGPQIFDVLSTRATLAGTTISSVFRQVGVTVYAALAPVLPIIAGIGAAVGAVAGAFAIGAREINDDVGSITDSLGLTEKQLKRVEDSGVATTVTLGDTFSAFFQVTGERLTEAFEGPLKWLSDAFEATYEFVRDNGLAAIKGIVGGFVGGFMAIKATWSALPAAIGDVAISAANSVIQAVEMMVNKVVARINGLLALANKGADFLGMDGFGQLSEANLGRIGNPYAGAARRTMATASGAFREGYASGGAAVDSFLGDVGDRAARNARDRVLDAAGERDRGATGTGPRTGRDSATGDAKEQERRAKAAEDFAKALAQETAEIGKNRIELKMMAADRAALDAPTEALAQNIRDAAAAWQQATIAQAVSDLRQELGDLNEQTEFENSLIGLNAEARAVANAEREIELRLRALERLGIDITTEAIQAETDAYIANARARGQREDAASSANAYADHIANLADNLRDAGNAFSDLFGIAGDGFNGLIDTLGTYYEFQAEQEARLAELREGSEEYFRVQAEGAQRMAELETEAYSRVVSGVKSMFSEKSAVYKALEAVEKTYAAIRLAMMVKELVTEGILTSTKVGGAATRMATDATETASSVVNSTARGAADGVAAFAKTLASLPFPFNLAAGAAVLAALVSVGVKVAGGGGSKGKASEQAAAQTEPAYSGPRDQYGNPTSGYSVLRPGATTVANDNYTRPNVGMAPADIGATVNSNPVYHINIEGNADERTVQQIQAALAETEDRAVERSRAAAARDRAASSQRQRIGGG